MKKQHEIVLLTCLLMLMVCMGCNKRPDGWPEIFPFKMTFTDNGQPSKNMIVIMNRIDGSGGNWGVGGVTDEKGVLVVKTSFQDYAENGAPAGKYKILLTVSPPPFDDSIPALQNLSGPELDAARMKLAKEHADKFSEFIPVSLRTPASPLEVEVTSSKTESEVHVELKDYR
ncbi:MAG: hypothetical protein FWH27_05635 [Planctomycetaceae bacterium]|nr:hypothetical protein [Planctomycetaceae bacterium]